MSKLCGEDLSTWVDRDSPFTQIVFIGYDDGPTSGAARCAANSETYRFEMLARDVEGTYDWQAWDQGQEIRIFSLALLPTTAFERFSSTLTQDESLRRMVEDSIYYEEVYSILEEANPPEIVIATHGITTKLIAASPVTSEELTSVQDWFSFLGLTADPRPGQA